MAIFVIGFGEYASAGVNGKSWQFNQSGVELTRVYSDWRSDYEPAQRTMGPIYFIDCAKYENRGKRAISDIQVMFALASAGERRASQVLPYDTHAQVAVGNGGKACRPHAYENGYRGEMLVGWVNSVTYDDGSIWHAVPPVVGRARQKISSGVKLADPVTYLPLEECDDLTNISRKVITHIQIVFQHMGVDGSNLGNDALDIYSNILPGETVRNSCRGFKGRSIPGVFHYALALSHGNLNEAQPQVVFAGKTSHLLAAVSAVEFSDGSSWRTPGTRAVSPDR